MGGSANSLLWTQIKSDITGKPIVVPASDTATTLGAALLAGVGVGFYKDYDEAVSLTVKETRRHEPNPENKAVYDQTYQTYIELYKSLAHMMTGKIKSWEGNALTLRKEKICIMKAAVVVANEDVQYQEMEEPKVTKGTVKIQSQIFRYLWFRHSACSESRGSFLSYCTGT